MKYLLDTHAFLWMKIYKNTMLIGFGEIGEIIMKSKKIIFIFIILIVLPVFLSGCVPGDGTYDAGNPAGFFWGLWHGFIVWITFFMGLFTGGDYTIYEAANTGWAYNLGFLLGIGSCVGSIGVGGVNINGGVKICRREKD